MKPLVESITLAFPKLPPKLVGFRILHLTDIHIRRHRRRYDQLAHELAATEHDMLMVTGDVMADEGKEAIAFETAVRLLHAAKPRWGAFGVHGNHDTAEFRRRAEHLPVRWVSNRAVVHDALPLSILGVDCGEHERQTPRGDLLAALTSETRALPPRDRTGVDVERFRILLAHEPNWLPPAREAGLPLVLSGHTHGGQIRLPGVPILYNAMSNWPTRLSSGVLQSGMTTCVVARGLGESHGDGLRFFCRPHALLITLLEGPMESARGVSVVRKW